MKKLKFVLINIVFFSFIVNINAKSNPLYLEYEKLSESEKTNINYAPSKYVYEEKQEMKLIKSSDFLISSSSLPSKYDLRDVGTSHFNYAPSMRNQKLFGVCWAFSFNSMLESFLIKKGLDNNRNYDFSEIAMDIEQKALFEAGAGNSNYNNEYRYTYGLPSLKIALLNWTYFNPVHESLIASKQSSELPGYLTYDNLINAYVAEKNNSNVNGAINKISGILDSVDRYEISNSENYPFNVSVGLISSYYSTALSTENLVLSQSLKSDVSSGVNKVKEYIMNNGAVATITVVDNNFGNNNDNFVHNNFSNDNYASYMSNKTGHAVTIIGWDDNYGDVDGDNIGDGAWLVQNSWGNESKVAYFYLSYYDIFSLMETYGIFELDNKKVDNVYRNINKELAFDEDKINYSYKYYIGNSKQKIEYVKVLTGVSTTKDVHLKISDKTKSCTSTTKRVGTEINIFKFENCSLSGNIELNIYVNNYNSNDTIEAAVYTTNTKSNEKRFDIKQINKDSSFAYDNILFDTTSSKIKYDISFTGIKPSLPTIKVLNENGQDITNRTRLECEEDSFGGYKNCKFIVNNLLKTNNIIITYTSSDKTNQSEYSIKAVSSRLNKYYIKDAEDLLMLNNSNKLFVLNNDIDFSLIEKTSPIYGKSLYLYGSNIELDGKGYSIKNYNGKSGGLFQELRGSAINNLGITGFSIDNSEDNSSDNVGILVNNLVSSTLEGIDASNSTIIAKNAGGLIGKTTSSTIRNNHIKDVSIISGSSAGGIASTLSVNEYLETAKRATSIKNNFIENVTLTGAPKGNISSELNLISRDDNAYTYFKYDGNIVLGGTNGLVGEKTLRKFNGLNYILYTNYSEYISDVNNQNITTSDINNTLTIFSGFDTNYWSVSNNKWPTLKAFDIPRNIDSKLESLKKKNNIYLLLDNAINKTELNRMINFELFVYVSDRYGNNLNSDAFISTGSVIEFADNDESKYFYAVVRGDINGDGVIDILDFKKSSNYLLSDKFDNTIPQVSQIYAGDINGDNKIDILDFKKMSNYLLNGTY